jgi:hypothetical protein
MGDYPRLASEFKVNVPEAPPAGQGLRKAITHLTGKPKVFLDAPDTRLYAPGQSHADLDH